MSMFLDVDLISKQRLYQSYSHQQCMKSTTAKFDIVNIKKYFNHLISKMCPQRNKKDLCISVDSSLIIISLALKNVFINYLCSIFCEQPSYLVTVFDNF